MATSFKIDANFRQQFAANPYKASRQYAPWGIGTINPQFPRWDLLSAAVDRTLHNPFSDQTLEVLPKLFSEGGTTTVFGHCDLAVSKDAAALAFVGIDKIVAVDTPNGPELAPSYRVILQVRVVAPQGGRIEFRSIRSIIYKLRDYGFYIALVTFDGWQSIDSIQELNRNGISADQMSIDRTTTYPVFIDRPIPGAGGASLGELRKKSTNGRFSAPMDTLRTAIHEHRWRIPPYLETDGLSWWEREARDLEFNARTNTVTKNPSGTDDLIQALAGATFNAENNMVISEASLEYETEAKRYGLTQDLREGDDLAAFERQYFGRG